MGGLASRGSGDTSATADAVFDEALSGHTTAGTTGKAITDILEDTGTTIPSTISGLNNISAADVNTQVDGALNTVIPGSPTAGSINERVATLDDNYTATRAGYLDELGSTNIPADVDTVLSRLTATRAGYIDELAAANLPTDISNLDTKLTTIDSNIDLLVSSYSAGAGSNATTVVCSALAGWGDDYFNPNSWWIHIIKAGGTAPEGEWRRITDYVSLTGTFTTDAYTAAVAEGDNIMLSKDEFIVRKNRTFFSIVDDSISLPAAAADTNLPDIVLPNIRGTIIDVRVGIKIRMIENTSASGANALEGAQAIRIMKSGASWGADDVAAIDLSDNQWTVATSTREGGDVQIGDNDVASEVDAFNTTYNLRFEDANVDYDYLQLNDVQVFAIITYI